MSAPTSTHSTASRICLGLIGLGIVLDLGGVLAGGVAACAAAWFWVAGFAATALLTSVWFGQTLLGWFREKAWAPLLVLAVVGWCCFSKLDGWDRTAVNGESAIQVTAGIRNWSRPGLGYFESAFFGAYPARQYLLVALPSLWDGPGYVALRLGYAVAFFGGFWSLLAGLDAFWKRAQGEKTKAVWPALAAVSVVGCPVVVQFLRMFEQTLLPIAATMFFLGWGLRAWRGGPPWWTLPLAWSGGFLAGNYTPGLAAWCLALAALGLMAWRAEFRRHWPRPLVLGVLFSTLASGLAVQWAVREELAQRLTFQRFGDTATMPLTERLDRFGSALRMLFDHSERPFFSALMVFPIVAVLLAGVAGKLRPRWLFAGVALWALAGVALAVTLRGLFHREVGFDLHRAMVVLPPVLVGVAAVWRNWWGKQPVLLPALLLGVMSLQILIELPKVRDIASNVPYRAGLGDVITGEVVALSRSLPGSPGETPLDLIISTAPGFPKGLEFYLGYFCPHPETHTWYEERDVAALVAGKKAFVAFHPPGREQPEALATAGVRVVRGEGWDAENKRMVPYEGWIYAGSGK